MDNSMIDQIIVEAIQKLNENPYDAGHDLQHAQAVWKTAQDIITHLQLSLEIDKRAVKIACYWHDVVVKPKNKLNPAGENVTDTAIYLKRRMQQLEFSPNIIRTTYLAVRYHQYDDTPRNLEGKVLWDADKLEAVNLDRWLHAKQAVESGTMSIKTLDSYINTGLNWLKTLRTKFHFDYSRTLFDQRLSQLTHHPEFQQLAQTKDIDLNQLLANVQSTQGKK